MLWQAHSDQLCRQLASQLALPLVEDSAQAQDFALLLVYTPEGLGLQQTGTRAGPVRVDFAGGAADYRRTRGGGELIVKAVGGSRHSSPSVVDATAGLGRDSFVLAAKGCRVTLCERSPVVAALLADGLARGQSEGDDALLQVLSRMQLQPGDAADYLRTCDEAVRPDVVLIDPMFPASGKSAQVKKEMQAFQSLLGKDEDVDALLHLAREIARYRVVVKRPRKGDFLGGVKPGFSLTGKAIRFDVYALRAFPRD